MSKLIPVTVARMLFSAALSVAVVTTYIGGMTPAEAQRTRSFSHGVHGPNGHGYTHSGTTTRGGGSGASTRSFQTDGGYGVTSNRSHGFSDGSFNGSSNRTLNNGTSWGMSTSATANGHGGADYTRTYTGPNGQTATHSGTVGHQH